MWRKIKRLAMKYDDCQLYREKIFLFFHDALYVKITLPLQQKVCSVQEMHLFQYHCILYSAYQNLSILAEQIGYVANYKKISLYRNTK